MSEQLSRRAPYVRSPRGLQVAIETELLGCLDSTSCLTLSITSRGLLADVGRSLTALRFKSCSSTRQPHVHEVEDLSRKSLAALDGVLRRYGNLREIEALDMWIDQSALESIASHCPQLRSCWLEGWKISSLEPLAACGHLQRLVLDDSYHLTPQVFISFAQRCSRLTSVTLQHSDSWITDTAIIELARNCPNLRELNLDYEDPIWGENPRAEGAEKLTDRAFIALAEHCVRLEALRGQWLPTADAGLLAIGRQCRNLRVLHLDGVVHVTREGFTAFASVCTALDTVIVDLYGRDDFDENNPIVDGPTIGDALAAQSLPLRNFGCTHGGWGMINWETDPLILPALFRAHRQLVAVDLNFCHADEAVILALAEYCPQLRALCVRYGGMTDVSTVALAAGCAGLETLVLDSAFANFNVVDGLRVSAESFRALAQLASLKSLYLRYDWKNTGLSKPSETYPDAPLADPNLLSEYVRILGDGLPTLVELYLECHGTTQVVASIAARRPALMITDSGVVHNARPGPYLGATFYQSEPVYWTEKRFGLDRD